MVNSHCLCCFDNVGWVSVGRYANSEYMLACLWWWHDCSKYLHVLTVAATATSIISPVSQSGIYSLCSRSNCPPLQTILCQRKCISQRHASVGMWSSQVVLGQPLEHLQEGSGWYPSPEAQQIERMLDAGTSRLNLATWPNNPNRQARTMLMKLSKPDVAATVMIRDEVWSLW